MTDEQRLSSLPVQDLRRLLDLLRDSDSAELKVTVPEADHAAVTQSLGLDPLDAQIRQVYFFDTPDLRLYENGIVVRARRVQGKGDDTVVKLRPVDPVALSPDVRGSSSFGVEVDAMPGGRYVCSGSLKGTAKDVRGTIQGGRALSRLFSKEQRALYTAYAPDGIQLDDLIVLGPIFVLKLKFEPEILGRRLVAELWLYPDGSRVFELSTKCQPTEAFQVASEVRAFLGEHDIDLEGEQQTKTRKALEFFSHKLRT
jgi:hypothetical protein